MLAGSENNPFAGIEKAEDLPMAVPDDRITARIDGRDQIKAKLAAVEAHASQIPESSWLRTWASSFGDEFMGLEFFELVAGSRGPAGPENGWEDDLFAGLAVAEPGSASLA
jgi:N-acetyl-1-D-myo-inositol-2-amino-2-deoxy-alpha-D-glucopyranoside deacetylase